jgi:hypothetical protein
MMPTVSDKQSVRALIRTVRNCHGDGPNLRSGRSDRTGTM